MSLYDFVKREILTGLARNEQTDVSGNVISLETARELARDTKAWCKYFPKSHRYVFSREGRFLGMAEEGDIV